MELANEATNTQGNALANQEKYEESLAGKTQQITTQMQAFWMSVADSKLTRVVVEVANLFTQLINFISDKIGSIPLALAGALGALKGADIIKTFFANVVKEGVSASKALKTAFSTVGKAGLTGNLIVLGITTAISLIYKAVDYYAKRSERILERAEKARDNIENLSNDTENKRKETDELLEKYNKLRGGVKYTSTGIENVSLSLDEFNEFLDTNNKIGELYPSLITGTSEYGDVLTNLSSEANQASEEVKKYYDELARGNAIKILNELPDTLAGAQQKSSALATPIGSAQRFISSYEDAFDWIAGETTSGSMSNEGIFADQLAWIYDEIRRGLSIDEAQRILLDFNDINSEYTFEIDTSGLDDQAAKEFVDRIKTQAYDSLSAYYEEDITKTYNQTSKIELPELERQMSSTWDNDFIDPLIAALPAFSEFNEMNPLIQTSLQNYMRNFDYEDSVFADSKVVKDPKKLQQAIYDTFLNPFVNAFQSGLDEKQFTQFYKGLDGIKDKTVDDVNKLIDEWDRTIFSGDDDAVHTLKVALGLEVELEDGSYQSITDSLREQVAELFKGKNDLISSDEFSELKVSQLEDIVKAYAEGFNFTGNGFDELWDSIDEFYGNVQDEQRKSDTMQDLLTLLGIDNSKKTVSETFESEMSSIQGAIDKLQNGEFTSSDMLDLSELFPDVANTPLPELQSALEKLAGTKLSGFLDYLDEQRESLNLTDEAMEKYLAYVQQILLANGANANISYRDTISAVGKRIPGHQHEFLQEFGDEMSTEKGRGIIYTLSANPDSANWALGEWRKQYDQMEIQVDLVIGDNELEDYISQQEKKIGDNDSRIGYYNARIANKEANRNYNTETDYGYLIGSAEDNVELRKDIATRRRTAYNRAQKAFRDGIITQPILDISERLMLGAFQDVEEAEADLMKYQEEEVRGGAKATDDKIADKERQLSELQQKISESGKEATVEQLEQQIKLQEEIGNLNTEQANYYAQFGDKYADDAAKYRENASNARESTRNLQAEMDSYGKYVVEDLDAQNASYSAQIAELKTAIEGKKTTQGEWSVTEDDYAEILNLQDLISANLSEKVAQTKEIYEKNLTSRIDEEREKGNRVTAKELLKSDNDLMQLRTNWLNAQNELSEHQNEMIATQIESEMTNITRLNHEFDQLQTEADTKQSEIDRYVEIVGEQAESQYNTMAEYYRAMAQKQTEIANAYRNMYFGFGETLYADKIAQAEQNATNYNNQANDIINGRTQRQRDRQTTRLENRRNNNKVEIGRIEAENAVIEAQGDLLSPENYRGILSLQEDSLSALADEIETARGAVSDARMNGKSQKEQDEAQTHLQELLSTYAQEEYENIQTQIDSLEASTADEQRAVTEAQRTVNDIQNDIDNKRANNIEVTEEEYAELANSQRLLSTAQETLANAYLGIAEDNADNYAIWSHFQDLGTQAQQESDTTSTNEKQTDAAYSVDELERLDRQLQILQDSETAINNIISDKQVKGLKVQEKDYRTLIALSKAQKVNLQAQNKELQTQYNITKDKTLLDQIRQNNLSAMGIDSAILGYENTLKTLLVDQAKDLSSAISSALSEVVTETGLTNETIDGLVTGFSDLGDRAEITSKLLYGSADGMKVDVRALQQMAEAERNLVNSQFTAKIKEQKDAIQRLMDSGDTSGLKRAQDELQYLLTQQTEYFALYQQQMNAFNEHGRIDIADQTANAGDNYDKAMQYLKDAKEMWDKGLVGTDDFKARAAYFDDFGLTDAETFKKNYDKINKYFTEDISGIRKYISDMQTNGLLVQQTLSDGSTALVGNFKDVSEAAQKMGISEQMFLDMAGKMHDYGGNIAFVTSMQDAALQASDLSQQLTNAQLEYADLIAQGASEDVLKKKQEEIDLIKQSIEGLDMATQAYIDGTAEDYIESFDTLQARVQALAEARKEAMERGDLDAQKTFEDEINRLAEKYHIEINFEGEFDEQSLEDAKQQAMDALFIHGTLDNPLDASVFADLGTNQHDMQQYTYAQGVFQSIGQGNLQQLEHLGLDRSDISTVATYIGELQSLGVTYEELSKVQLSNGAYELTGDMSKAEDALEGIAKALGFSKEDASLLVKALASLGLIDYPVAETEAMMEYLEGINETIDEINKNGDVELSFTIEDGGSSLEYLNTLSSEDLQSQIEELKVAVQLDLPQEQLDILQRELDLRETVLSIKTYVENADDTTATITYLQDLLTKNPEAFAATVGITLSEDTETAEQQIETFQNILTNIQENSDASISVKLDAEQFEALTAADDTTTIDIDADNSKALSAVEEVKDAAESADPVITIKGNNKNAKQAVDEAVSYANRQDVRLTVNADLSRAVQDINELIRQIQRAEPEMKIVANAQHFIQTFQQFLESQQFTANIVARLTGTVNHVNVVEQDNGSSYTGTMNRVKRSGSAYNMINLAPAHADGTNGVALPHDETSLVSELGQESIVRNGRWYLLPAGAHFENLKKGDLVFNAEQTAALLQGRMLSEGESVRAYANGTLTSRAGGYIQIPQPFGQGGANNGNNNGNNNSLQDNSDAIDDNTDAVEDNTETFDWVERRLKFFGDKVTEIADTITDYVTSAFKKLKIEQQLKAIEDQITANYKAAETYRKKADSIELSDEYKEKVRNGEYSIEDIDTSTEEGKKLAENIQEYQNWYDKMRECEMAIAGLREEQLGLYNDWLNIPAEDATDKIDALSNAYDQLGNKISAFQGGHSTLSHYSTYISSDVKQAQKQKAEVDRLKKAWNALQKQNGKKSTKASLNAEEQARTAYYEALANYKASGNWGLAGGYGLSDQLYDPNISLIGKDSPSYVYANAAVKEQLKNLDEQSKVAVQNAKTYSKLLAEQQKRVTSQRGNLSRYGVTLSEADKQLIANGEMLDASKWSGQQKRAVENYNQEIQKLTLANDAYTEAINQAKDAELERARAQAEAVKTMQENIAAVYDAEKAYRQSRVTWRENIRSNKEHQGQQLVMSDYTNELKELRAQWTATYQEAKKQDENLAQAEKDNLIERGSEEWKNLKVAINENYNDARQLLDKIEELQDEAREQMYFKPYDEAIESLEELRDSYQTVRDMIVDDMKYDEQGRFTNFGFTNMAYDAKEYVAGTAEIRTLLQKREQILKQYNNGDNDTAYSQEEFENDLSEINKKIREQMTTNDSYRRKVISDILDQAKAELDYTNKLIDAESERWKKQKEYYDWDKQVKAKTKDIELLKQQIKAIDGVATAEAKAQKARLAAQLQEAQEDLDDAIHEHVYEMKVEGLEELKDDLQERFDNYSKELNGNLTSLNEALYSAIATINKYIDTANATTEELVGSFGNSQLSMITAGLAYLSNTKNADTKLKETYSDENGVTLSALDQSTLQQFERLMNSQYLQLFANPLSRPQLEAKSVDVATGTQSVTYNTGSLLTVNGNVDADLAQEITATLQSMIPSIVDQTKQSIKNDAYKAGY